MAKLRSKGRGFPNSSRNNCSSVLSKSLITLRLLTPMCLLLPEAPARASPLPASRPASLHFVYQGEVLAKVRFSTGLAHFLELAPGCQNKMFHMNTLPICRCQKRGIEDDVFDVAASQLELPRQE